MPSWRVCRCRHPKSSTMSNGLRGSKVMHQSCVDSLISEEPDDRIGHVRICGEWAHDTHLSMSLKIKGILF